MTDPPVDSVAEPSDSEWNRIEQAIRRLERSWHASPTPELSRFVPEGRGMARRRLLVELVKVDLEYRWRARLEQKLEAYLEQWPELADDSQATAELLRAECLTRALFGTAVARDELHQRFGRLGDQLDLEAIELQARQVQSRPPGAQGRMSQGPPPPEAVWRSLPVGRRFGRYEILQELGGGGMGRVYRAYDHHMRRDVALKIPRFADPRLIDRFSREPQTAAAIEHRNVCRIYDAGLIGDTPYIAMELIRGTTLAAWLKCRSLEPRVAATIARRIALALAKVHDAGIVHRDVKASNVMVDEDNEPVLMDFGLARPAQELSDLTGTGSLLGTLPYMAPEQLHGKVADVRSDVYSLGIVLYEMLTGQLPCRGPLPELLKRAAEPSRPSKLRSDIDADLDIICQTATATRREHRYQSAQEMANALGRYLEGLPQARRPPLRLRGKWYWTAAAVAATLFVLGGIAVYLLTSTRGQDPVPIPAPPVRRIDRWIETEPRVGGICLSGGAATLYAAYREDTSGCRIQKIDVGSGEVLKTIRFGYQHTHGDVVLFPDERFLYTTNYYKRYISRIDLRRADERTDLDIGGAPTAVWAVDIGMTPDQKLLVVALGQDGRTSDMRNDYLSIVDIDGGAFQLVGQVALDDEPTGHKIGFSADSRFAYVVTRRRRSKASTLYEVRLAPPGKVIRTLGLPGDELAGVAISSSLRRAFVSDRTHRQVCLVDLESFRPEAAFRLNDHAPGTLAVDPWRNLLAVLCPESRTLYFVNARTCELISRVPQLREQCLDMEFSRDGTQVFVASRGARGGVAIIDVHSFARIVFASDRAGEGYQLYTVGTDGRDLTRLTRNHASDVLPRWSRDGHRIAFVSNRTGRPRICLVHRDGTGLVELERTDPVMPENGSGASLDWSPDGHRVAFVSRDQRAIRAVDVRTGAVVTPLPGPAAPGYAQHLDLCWMSDGTILLASENPEWSYDRDLFRLDPGTGRVVQVTNDQGKTANTRSPTGWQQRIAALRQLEADAPAAGIFVQSTSGSRWQQVTPAPIVDPRAPRWLADGKRLAFSACTGQYQHLHVLDVESGQIRQVTRGESNDIYPDVFGYHPDVPDLEADSP